MKIAAGTTMPPTAAAIGSAARARVAQVTGDELALEFQPDDEEEDRQQPVGRPRRDAQAQMQRLRADRELRDRVVGVRPRRVGPHQRRARGDQQQDAADGLLAQDLGEPLGLRPRPAGQQATADLVVAIAHRVLPGSAVHRSPTRLPGTPAVNVSAPPKTERPTPRSAGYVDIVMIVERQSVVEAPAEQVWARVVTPEGINDEVRPWMTMSMPRGAESLTVDDVPIGAPDRPLLDAAVRRAAVRLRHSDRRTGPGTRFRRAIHDDEHAPMASPTHRDDPMATPKPLSVTASHFSSARRCVLPHRSSQRDCVHCSATGTDGCSGTSVIPRDTSRSNSQPPVCRRNACLPENA